MSLIPDFGESILYWLGVADRVPPDERTVALKVAEGLTELALRLNEINHRNEGKPAFHRPPKLPPRRRAA
jgi:hypothetical protein